MRTYFDAHTGDVDVSSVASSNQCSTSSPKCHLVVAMITSFQDLANPAVQMYTVHLDHPHWQPRR